MAYDEDLASRISEHLTDRVGITEKAMFGGLAFLLHANMAVGITNSGELMVRVGPAGADDALARPHTRPFDMTGRPMKGWIVVAPEGFADRRELGRWGDCGVTFAASLPPKA